ncbi:lipoprotein intramolecular transacylase Lit [Limosilactobacillus caecicola]|uniref:lipoprotein intramolecular transacylase Lit n=1 Tax=Limosilactobacillus caecicola TaxID=2941332 RepID=UPI00203EB741|nr:DUF1461 domain-containing protein [Limosilactobacillus caecicola]
MIGKLRIFKDNLVALLTIVAGMLTTIGLSFFGVLLGSGCLVEVPSHGLLISHRALLHDYYRLVWYLIGFSNRQFNFKAIQMSEAAQAHFADVQGLITIGEILTVFAVVIFVALFGYEKERYQLWRLAPLFIQMMIFECVIIVMVLISFQDSFLWFHYHAFHNLNWIFSPYSDPIILVLTNQYFLHYLLGWAAACLALQVALLLYIKHLIYVFLNR